MKRVPTALIFAAAVAVPFGLARAQSSDPPKDVGYANGSSDSGRSGMASSRGVPTSPTAGQPGTVDNGNPAASGSTGTAKTDKTH